MRAGRRRYTLALSLLTVLITSIAVLPAVVAQDLATPIVDFSSESLPGNWPLTCTAPAAPVTPGRTAAVSCAMPDAAWSQRGSQPTAFATVDPGSNVAIDAATFTILVLVPCSAGDGRTSVTIEIVANLGHGIELRRDVAIPIDSTVGESPPLLTIGHVKVGQAVWDGVSYQPASGVLSLSVSQATTSCGKTWWTVQLRSASVSSQRGSFDASVAITGGTIDDSDTTSSIPATNGPSIASGQGNASIVILFDLTLPASAPVGAYQGNLEIELVPQFEPVS